TKQEKKSINGFARRTHQSAEEVKYEAEFEVPKSFGEIGAILVENEHHREMFIKEIVLDGFELGPVNFSCNSWVHAKNDSPVKRVFFPNKLYLPSETPEGVKRLRKEELEQLRGNGKGERKRFERIYDYDVYNDLGNPDSSPDLKRPVLGGAQHPYPRRCRTGRPPSKTDPLSEERSSTVYVPRDENFSDVKQLTFSAKSLYSGLHALIPTLENTIVDKNLGFPVFSAIDNLFDEGLCLPPLEGKGLIRNILPRLIRSIKETEKDILRFEPPATMDKDRFFWLRDEEFGRQTLAGLNPCCIQLVTEWPLKSKLDPEIYGPAESAITTELIEEEIKGFFTVQEAIKQKKLFILDYHDLLLPLVKEVRQLKGTTLYGSRALFFLTHEGTLRPLAIELTRPPMDGKPQWKHVFRPAWHSTGVWLWRLAKLHILAHDSGYHQLVSHWYEITKLYPTRDTVHSNVNYCLRVLMQAANSLCDRALHNSSKQATECDAPDL
ncbi:Linoleate 13S-lipoxygenase 2-1, chloroplastic, partial [Mucuna pruriens]